MSVGVGVGVGVFAVFNRLACGLAPEGFSGRAEEKPAEGWLRRGEHVYWFSCAI